MKKALKYLPVILGLAFMGQACISFGGNTGNDGGVWRSEDRGENWLAKSAVLSVGGAQTLSGSDILTMVTDPQDPQTIYAGTAGAGLLYTVNNGESWFQPPVLGGTRVPSLAVDPKDKCTVYAISGGVALKTTDCTRTWTKIYEETRAETSLTWIAVDHFNSNIVYLATTKGDLFKSENAGNAWTPVNVFRSAANQVVIDPFDSRVLYVGTKNSGVWRSSDAGANWTDLSLGFETFDGAKDFYNLVPDQSKKGSFVLVCRFGLLRTDDDGATWEKISLVTQPGQARIYSLALNPKNGQEMYYSTATVFYKSTNGGANWTTKRLPTSRAGSTLMISAKDPNMVFLGTLLLKK